MANLAMKIDFDFKYLISLHAVENLYNILAFISYQLSSNISVQKI